MTIGDAEGLVARIRQLRRSAAARQPQPADPEASGSERLELLEARVAYLEQLLQGLQDSVHRESERHANLIAELQAQIQPGAMGASLAQDARKRGL